MEWTETRQVSNPNNALRRHKNQWSLQVRALPVWKTFTCCADKKGTGWDILITIYSFFVFKDAPFFFFTLGCWYITKECVLLQWIITLDPKPLLHWIPVRVLFVSSCLFTAHLFLGLILLQQILVEKRLVRY